MPPSPTLDVKERPLPSPRLDVSERPLPLPQAFQSDTVAASKCSPLFFHLKACMVVGFRNHLPPVPYCTKYIHHSPFQKWHVTDINRFSVTFANLLSFVMLFVIVVCQSFERYIYCLTFKSFWPL